MSLGTLKGAVPWWAKIGLKLMLSRLPVQYGGWRRLGLFVHGAMDDPTYAYSVFRSHFDRCKDLLPGTAFSCMEVGPGDSLCTAVAARAHGASSVVFVDTGHFARDDIAPYRAMVNHLQSRELASLDLSGCTSLCDVLELCRATYLTQGLRSMRTLPSQSVDWVWSQAVLEHVRASEFLPFMREMRRVMKPGAIASHRVDLRDHLAGALNNLRLHQSLWERDWFANAGFYTNRIRFSGMLEHFNETGFDVEVVGVDRWPALPTARESMAEEFRNISDDDLLVQGFDVLLRPTPMSDVTSETLQ